jgi:hypothetical protein
LQHVPEKTNVFNGCRVLQFTPCNTSASA